MDQTHVQLWTKPSLTMQLTSGMDVLAHVCGQKADPSSNYESKSKIKRILTAKFAAIMSENSELLWQCLYKFICVLLEIYFSFQQWKFFANLLRIDKVITMSFVGHTSCLQKIKLRLFVLPEKAVFLHSMVSSVITIIT